MDATPVETRRNGVDQLTIPFEPFYRRYWDDIYRPLALTIRNPDLARDAVDEAMTRAFQRWDQVGTYRNPQGWVYRVAYNWAITSLRKLRAERLVAHEVAVPAAARAAEVDVDLANALDRLPMKIRAVVVLRYLADQPERDVAQSLGIPVGTVKSRLSRALRRLEKELT